MKGTSSDKDGIRIHDLVDIVDRADIEFDTVGVSLGGKRSSDLGDLS